MDKWTIIYLMFRRICVMIDEFFTYTLFMYLWKTQEYELCMLVFVGGLIFNAIGYWGLWKLYDKYLQ